MKRRLLLIPALCLALSLALGVSFASADTAKISVSSAEGCPGDEVQIYVSLAGNPGITSLDFFTGYDSAALTLTKVGVGKVVPQGGFTKSETIAKNPYYTGWINSLVMTDSRTDGNLLRFTFEINEGAKAGTYPIRLTDVTGKAVEYVYAYNAALDEILFSVENGAITVKAAGNAEGPGNASGNGSETGVPTDNPSGSSETGAPAGSTSGGGGGTGAAPAVNDQDITDVTGGDSASGTKPGEGEISGGETTDTEKTEADRKLIAKVEAMKVKITSKTYSRSANTYKLTYVKSNSKVKVDGYVIYRSGKKSSGYKKIKTTTGKSFTDKSLKRGKTYYYKIKAYREIGGKKYYTAYSDKIKLVTTKKA